MPYVNPIPAIDVGKQFEMRLSMHFDEPIRVEDAKLRMAKYLLEQSPETLASWIHCGKCKAMYPDDLTEEQKKEFGLYPYGQGPAEKERGEEDG